MESNAFDEDDYCFDDKFNRLDMDKNNEEIPERSASVYTIVQDEHKEKLTEEDNTMRNTEPPRQAIPRQAKQ